MSGVKIALLSLLIFFPALSAGAQEKAKAPRFGFGGEVRMPILLGDPAGYNPRIGIGFGVKIAYFYAPHLGVELAIDHDRFWRRVSEYLPVQGGEITRTQTLSYTSFIPAQTFTLGRGIFSVAFTVGFGFTVAFFSNPLKNLDERTVIWCAKGAVDFQLRIAKKAVLGLNTQLIMHADGTRIVNPNGDVPGQTVRVFDHLLAVGLRLEYRF